MQAICEQMACFRVYFLPLWRGVAGRCRLLSVIYYSNSKTTKEMKKILVTFCLAAAMAGLSSCGSTKQAAASLADINGEWNIIEINGAAVVPAPGQAYPYIGFDKATGRLYSQVFTHQPKIGSIMPPEIMYAVITLFAS